MTPARDDRVAVEKWPAPYKSPKVAWPKIREVLDAPPGWTSQAACVGLAPLHDPPYRDEPTAAWRARYREARAVCRGCPVLRECDQYADEHKLHGIWGGRVRGVGRGAVSVRYPDAHVIDHPYLTTDDESETPA